MAKSNLKIDFSEIKDFERRLLKSIKESEKQEKYALLKATTLVHREAVNNTKAGVKYSDGVYETGNLRRALSFDIPSPKYGQVFISKGLKYPKFVEQGTRNMRAKPFLMPALTENWKEIRKIWQDYIKSTLKVVKK